MCKKIFLVLLCFYLIQSDVIGQPQIVSLKILPENILNSDIVKIVAETSFDTQGARLDSSNILVNGNIITIIGHYFRNGATAPSESIDTIFIGKLKEADYTLIYNLMVPVNKVLDRDTIQFTVGVNNITNQNTPKLKIYPNPSNGLFTLSLPNTDKYTIEVFNYLGQSLDKIELQGLYEYSLNLKLEKGLYYLKVRNINGISYNEYLKIE